MPYSTLKQSFRLVVLLCFAGFFGYQFDAFLIGVVIILLFDAISNIYYLNIFISWLEDESNNIPNVNNTWSTIMGRVSKKLTKLKASESSLKSLVNYFQESFHVLDDAVIILDDVGKIVWVNKSAYIIFGINLDNDKNQSFNNLVRDPDLIAYLESNDFEKTILITSSINLDIKIELKASRFRENHIIIFARDVTDNLKLEIMRREFVANVSHELKTPLTVITGYLQVLNDHSSSIDIRDKAIKNMLMQSDRMNNIIQDLTWLSKLESLPKDTVNKKFFSLYTLFETIRSDFLLPDSNKIIDIKYPSLNFDNDPFFDKETFEIIGNFDELRSAFSNLLENGIKYSNDHAVITISFRLTDDKFIIDFIDNGNGIEKRHLPRLTERFYRIDDSRSSETGGSGLGLSIVKHILARHYADLEISSELGVGSTFSCVFSKNIIKN